MKIRDIEHLFLDEHKTYNIIIKDITKYKGEFKAYLNRKALHELTHEEVKREIKYIIPGKDECNDSFINIII